MPVGRLDSPFSMMIVNSTEMRRPSLVKPGTDKEIAEVKRINN